MKKNKNIIKPFESCMRMIQNGEGLKVLDSPEYHALSDANQNSDQKIVKHLVLSSLSWADAELIDDR